MGPISYTPSTNGRCIIGFPTSFTWGYPIDVHLKAAMGHLLSLSPNRHQDPGPSKSKLTSDVSHRQVGKTNERTNKQTDTQKKQIYIPSTSSSLVKSNDYVQNWGDKSNNDDFLCCLIGVYVGGYFFIAWIALIPSWCIYIYTCLHIKLYICVCECVCNYIYIMYLHVYIHIYIL